MKKRLLSVLVTMLILVSLMAGCQKNSDTAAGPASTETKEAAATTDNSAAATQAPAAGANTLTVWCWDPAFNIYAMEQAAEVYKKSNPDFVLNVVETPWDDLQTKLTTAATSGNLDTLPDIFLCQDNAFQKYVMSYPDLFTDLSGKAIDFTKFAPAKTAYSVVDSKNYGVPFDNGAVIACYRTDVLTEAGYTVADFTDISWTKYLELGKDILAKTGKPLLSCQAGNSDVIMMMLQSCGASLFDASGNPAITGNDKLKAVLKVYNEMITSGVLVLVNDWDQYIGTLNSGTCAGTINGCWIMGSIQSAADQSGKWAITNMPKLDGIDGATNYSNNGGSSWAVTSNCKNVDLAADFFAKTFGGSVELYETILPSSGALATYLPAADSDVYSKPSEFFGGDTVFAKITDFAGKVPSNNTGIYYYEARDAVATAATNIIAGAEMDAELATAQSTVEFAMGK